MVRPFVAVWESTIRGAVLSRTILSARAPSDLGTLHLLDGYDASERPEIRVGKTRVLLLDGLEQVTDDLESCVGAVV